MTIITDRQHNGYRATQVKRKERRYLREQAPISGVKWYELHGVRVGFVTQNSALKLEREFQIAIEK